MQVSVKGKQLDVGDALRTHITEAVEAVTAKYFENPMECTVVLSKEAHLFRSDIQAHIGRGILIQAHGEAADPYAAFDAGASRIAKQLRRYKRRLRDHHRNHGDVVGLPAQQRVIAPHQDEDENETAEEAGNDGPVIVADMETAVETLSVSEAVMRMELADLPAMMFRNKQTGGIGMVFHRPDGNIGWVETDLAKLP